MSFKYLQVARIRGNYLLSQNILMLSFLYNNNNNIIINNSFINNIYIYIYVVIKVATTNTKMVS